MDGLGAAASVPASILEATHSLISLVASDEDAQRVFTTTGVQVSLCLIDTNDLLTDIKYRLTTGRMTGLMEAALVGSTRVVASPQVCGEVGEHLGAFVAKYGVDPAAADRVWRQEYLPRLTVVDPTGLALLSSTVVQLAQRDADDVPTGQLVELLQPDTVFSRDNDLAAFGTTARDTARIAVAYRTLARRDATVIVVYEGGSFALTLTAETVKATATAVHSLVDRMDKRLLMGLVVGCGLLCLVLFLWPTSRRWLGEHAKKAMKPLSLAERGLEAYARMESGAREVRQTLAAVRRPETAVRRSAREYAALVLGRAPGPLTVRTITVCMRRAGYRTRSAHPEQHVARVLRRHPRLFERVDTRRWHLRQQPIQRSFT